ncbi:MAG: hypothetical protein ACHQ4H_15820 [Ktedonobacterales bacterium]
MSEFERFRRSSAWTGGAEPEFPGDFSADEVDFATELQSLFVVEHEELPPLYAQTLLENERLRAAEHSLGQMTAYRVFQRLRLRRDLALGETRRGFGARQWGDRLRSRAQTVSRPMAGAMAALMAVMVLTVVLASPSFASGLRLILGQTGVVQTARYPSGVRPYGKHGATQHSTNFDAHMPLAWLGRVNGNYLYKGVQLQDAQEWSKGAIVDLQYQIGVHTDGTGVVDIREFQLNSSRYAAVLQVVATGSATPTQINSTTPAVYVDGTWMPRGIRRPTAMTSDGGSSAPFVWETGTRSELIFEQHGVIFWMVGDQRDGTDMDTLVKLAGQFQAVQPAALQPTKVALLMAGSKLLDTIRDPDMGHEVYQEVAAGTAPDAGPGWFVASTP